jgi:cystathionine beta-lyase/cystathionine gamma-synthase
LGKKSQREGGAQLKFATKAIHAGQPADPATGATTTPIYLTSTFTQEEIGKHKGFEYSRTGNPTRAALEQCLAALDDAEYGLAFASGSAATAATLSILRPGDHVIAAEDLYGGTYRYFDRVAKPGGISFTYVDGRQPEEFERAVQATTRLVWIETPTNPLLQLVDIAAVAAICKARGLRLAVDNTFATPFFQRPLALGADIVVYSTTKYIGGHSDTVGGAVTTGDRILYKKIKFYQNAAGGVPSPLDAWLTLRGVKTLAVRMPRHEENAREIAQFLKERSEVESVYYPGLPSHPQHELAARQMSGFGGMVTFQIRGGREQANAFVKALKMFSFAESLGGVESLACHPATMTHASYPPEERLRRGITDGTIRLSVGIEDVEDLKADIDQALNASQS